MDSGFKFRLRCEYTIDMPLDRLQIYCMKTQFNKDGEIIGKVPSSINTTISDFLEMCTYCIASEQGENKSIDLASVGIRFGRETFDDRFFYCGDLQLTVGEVYIMYEILKRKISVNSLKMYKYTESYYIFLSRDGYSFIADKTLSCAGMFRISEILSTNFTVSDRPTNGFVTYGKEVSLGGVQSAWLEKGACHPYVNLRYRDMIMNPSLEEFNKLKMIITDVYSDFNFEI